MAIDTTKWDRTCDRFIAFFDIMGFKEMVERNDHQMVLKKLERLKEALSKIENFKLDTKSFNNVIVSETKTITFSDSIIIFSKSNKVEDACKILLDSAFLILDSLNHGIPIKGAISYGEVTVDFDNSLFFGRPIIDAYLLHDNLQLYTAVMDNHSENKIRSMPIPPLFASFFTEYKANFKSGKINHTVIRQSNSHLSDHIKDILKLKSTVSGQPRIYLDNTVEFLESLTIKK